MWELLLRMILDALTENRGVQVEFYNRFQYTVEVRQSVPTPSTQPRSSHFNIVFLRLSYLDPLAVLPC